MPKRTAKTRKPCTVETVPDDIPPPIAEAFEDFALQAVAAGRKRYSAQGLLELIRWHTAIERRGDFKCNNNWSAALARWFLARHPELPGFFQLRQRTRQDA